MEPFVLAELQLARDALGEAAASLALAVALSPTGGARTDLLTLARAVEAELLAVDTVADRHAGTGQR
jgi:hypothetical protein